MMDEAEAESNTQLLVCQTNLVARVRRENGTLQILQERMCPWLLKSSRAHDLTPTGLTFLRSRDRDPLGSLIQLKCFCFTRAHMRRASARE